MDDVDEFLASLEQFSSPSLSSSLNAAIQNGINSNNNNNNTGSNTEMMSRRRRRDNKENDALLSSSAAATATAAEAPRATKKRRKDRNSERTSDGSSSSTSNGGGDGGGQNAALAPRQGTVAGANSNSEWSCPLCTLINPADAVVCNACESPRPAAPIHTNTTLHTGKRVKPSGVHHHHSSASVGLQCPQCSYVHTSLPLPTRCEACHSVLPAVGSTNTGSEVSLSAAEAAAVPSTRLPSLQTDSRPPAMSSSGVNGAQGIPAAIVLPRDDEAGDSESGSDDDSDDSDGGGSEDSAASGPPQEQTTEEALDSKELVRFLSTLDAVPYDTLPCAPQPASMAARGALRPFQLQALYWMTQQEGGGQHQQQQNNNNSNSGSRNGSPTFSAFPNHNDTTNNRSNFMSDHDDAGFVSSADVRTVRGGILADYMGLGKTRTVLALCESTRDAHRYDRVTGSQVVSSATLIVCPTSLLSQWAAEIRNCIEGTRGGGGGGGGGSLAAPRVLRYHGARKKRLTLFQIAQDYDYVLTTYATIAHEPSEHAAPPGKLHMIHWRRIVLDEAHYIRNGRTRQSRTCVRLTATARWAVTATPVQNSLSDLFPLLQFLRVPHFGVVQWWNSMIVGHLNRDPQHPRAITALRLLFSSLLLRRTPDTLINGVPILELPPKDVRTQYVRLTPAEHAFYEDVHHSATAKLDRVAAAQQQQQQQRAHHLSTFSTAFEMLIRCRQACLHPYIVISALRRCLQLRDTDPEGESGGGTTANNNNNNSDNSDNSVAAAAAAATALKAQREKEAQERESRFVTLVNQFIDSFLKRRVKSGARGTAFFNELVAELQSHKLEERECIICLDTLNPPAILPCAHTFCDGCIRHALELNKVCPLCKAKSRAADVLTVPPELLRSQGMVGYAAAGAGSGVGGEGDPSGGGGGHREGNAVMAEAANVDVSMLSLWPPHLSSKTRFLIDSLKNPECVRPGEKAVVLSAFVTYLQYARYALEKEGIPCLLFTGKLNVRQKEKVLEEFARGSDDSSDEAAGGAGGARGGDALSATGQCSSPAPRVLLATLATCGVGLNLTCANHCYLMEPTWNPGTEEQALNRVHRIGQTRPVTITKLIAANTVEEKIELLCLRKRGLASYCFGGSGGGGEGTGRLRTEDLLALFVDPDEDEEEESESDSDDSDDEFDSSDSSSLLEL